MIFCSVPVTVVYSEDHQLQDWENGHRFICAESDAPNPSSGAVAEADHSQDAYNLDNNWSFARPQKRSDCVCVAESCEKRP